MVLLIIPTFLSAFLLFQIELIIAKLFLPNYGGSYLVWGACLVYFQAMLLAGYVFAHTLLKRMGTGAYLKTHVLLLVLPFLFFPLHSLHLSFTPYPLPLVLDIFFRLGLTIGPVFFVLSTMSLVTQSWLAASILKGRDNPYGLYAVSNLGSFAGLLSYPFLFERYLTNTEQLEIWRVVYVILTVFNLVAFKFIKISKNNPFHSVVPGPPIKIFWGDMARWLALGAAGVVMFMSVTNIITYEVAPVPLLWIIPLGVYLLAFVLNFKRRPWCPSWMAGGIGPVLGLAAMMYFLSQKHLLPIVLVIGIHCVLLFFICMYTQHQLIRSKPSAQAMTLFYVMISLGGFLGGMLTSWIIPIFSSTLLEYLAGLLLVALSLQPAVKPLTWWQKAVGLVLAFGGLAVWPVLFKEYHLLPFVLLCAGMAFSFGLLARDKNLLALLIAVIMLVTPWLESIWQNAHFILKKRNYYGIYEIYDNKSGIRALIHGTTLHGVEFVAPDKRILPLGYYSPISPIGSLLIDDTFKARRVAVVGLGAGTLSMYAKPACPVDFYELDADVKQMASKYFWYLGNAPGHVNVILGDARLSLGQAPDKSYDLLVIDAFSGDSIPTHLVNKDVLVEYRRKLVDRGAIVFHITNRYLNLAPVLAKIAQDSGAYAALKDVGDQSFNMRSIWCLLTWDTDRFAKLITQEDWVPLVVTGKDRVWSDDYSSVLPIINMDELAVSFKSFKPLTW